MGFILALKTIFRTLSRQSAWFSICRRVFSDFTISSPCLLVLLSSWKLKYRYMKTTNNRFQHLKANDFWKHCGKRKMAHEEQFLLFQKCFHFYSIIVCLFIDFPYIWLNAFFQSHRRHVTAIVSTKRYKFEFLNSEGYIYLGLSESAQADKLW